MAGHHHQYRPHRLSLPQRAAAPLPFPAAAAATPRQYHLYPSPYPPSTPTPTPSKHRLSSLPHSRRPSSKASLSFLLLLLLSLRSLYSLLPFLRSSTPSFSLFPFSFLVSLLSFLLTLAFSSFPLSLPSSSNASSKDPFLFQPQKQNQPLFSFSTITQSQRRLVFAKSLLLAVVFLLRFQALRYCGAAAMILAEFSGDVAARFVAKSQKVSVGIGDRNGPSKVRGIVSLFTGLFLLCISWDRIECFPLSNSNTGKWELPLFPKEQCLRVLPMLLPFLSGFLGCYEREMMNWGTIRQLGVKRIRLISLFFTTLVLFIPAAISIAMFGTQGDGIAFGSLGWPLANTVVFGVILSENFSDDGLAGSKDFQKEFFVTFLFTVALELFYFPELSLWGLLLCGLLLWVAIMELDPGYLNHPRLGSSSSDSLGTSIMKPIHHILSEKKSRKIALFLLINTGYMVVEFVAGFMSNSLGLVSDACHMLFDCAALAIGLYASYISRLPANGQFNYGRGRFEVLSGYVNAVLLVLVGVLIVLESLERILDPQEISTSSLLVVSIGGLVVNLVGLVFFHEEHHHAHGGSGPCPHSHSHSDNRSHDHASGAHVYAVHIKHEDCASHGSCERSGDGHDNKHDNDPHGCSGNVTHDDSGTCTKNQKILTTDSDVHGHHVDLHHHAGHHHHHPGQHPQENKPDISRNALLLESVSKQGKTPSELHCHHHHVDHHHHHPGQHPQGNEPGISRNALFLESDQGKAPSEHHNHHHHHIDHNMEGIFLHVLADALGSVGVVISTLLIKYKGWLVADPACSIFISVLIISSVLPLLRNSAEILLQRVPRAHEWDLKEALDGIMKLEWVCGIQNLHAWSFTNTDVVGTFHLLVSSESEKAPTRARVSHILHDAGIKDLTLQVECVERN